MQKLFRGGHGMGRPCSGVTVALIGIGGVLLYLQPLSISTRAGADGPKYDVQALPAADGQNQLERDQGGRSQLYVLDASGANQINNSNSNDTSEPREPAWSPDGTKLVYTSKPFFGGPPEIWVMNADGIGKTKLYTASSQVSNPDWSPDGKKIAFDI